MSLPKIGQALETEHIEFLKTFTKSCRKSILQMVTNAQSGHPGGSLSSIDFLATFYAYIVSQTGEKVVVSNGHISPAVYSVLAELGYIPKEEVVRDFRKSGSIYEGHTTRHVDGIFYGTGPLGIGLSVGAALADCEKRKGENKKVFTVIGDGEAQEGQIYEAIHFASNHKIDNLITFVDYNKVQLTASLKDTFDIDIPAVFKAAHWQVIEINGHDYSEIWKAIGESYKSNRPVAIIAHTIMGKGVDFMEPEGDEHRPTWHGKAPKPEEAAEALQALTLSSEENAKIEKFKETIKWRPEASKYPELLSPLGTNTGEVRTYSAETFTDCRSAYGNALLDLAKNNKKIIALTADLKGSVKTDLVSENLPEQYIECGITEQNMLSLAGGYSTEDYIPFASTFGAFISSRAKDQARVNDINYTNVKMVATHCGLSVGEDGPTHQAIDDAGSFLGFFNTMILEPADPNQTDRIIRYIASHYGNFYVRMGRHKFPVLTKEDGTPFYDENYKFEYGTSDLIRKGSDLTIAASGPMVTEALKAINSLKENKPSLSIELIAISSIKKFDETIKNSIIKTKKLITIEDHNTLSGLGGQLARFIAKEGLQLNYFHMMGVEEYQLSGTHEELYEAADLSSKHITEQIKKLL
jgi:transketolase